MSTGKRYASFDGLRAYSAIGIAMMHILTNGKYDIGNGVINTFLASLGDLVYLFMMLSAFSMCCGYYERFQNQTISLENFYARRFQKTWGFFALICVIDVVISPSLKTIYELFANLTLCFGLLPNSQMEVVGVGWFLGLVFVFYMLFPFFCYLFGNKKRAWFTFGVTVVFHVLCRLYFLNTNHVVAGYDMRTNILAVAMFFAMGGLLYLYRESLAKFAAKYKYLLILFNVVMVGVCLYVVKNPLVLLVLMAAIILYAIGNTGLILSNKMTKFIGSISLEIYLCHMMFFRIVEKLGFTHIFGQGVLSYVVTTVLTLGGAIIFSVAANRGLAFVSMKIKETRRKNEDA